MTFLQRRWPRIAITLLPLLFALLHASGLLHLSFVERLDNVLYDIRMRATAPRTLDPRIVIVDIDDDSLQQFGRWPWSRDKLARLTTEIMDRQHAAVLGFDVVFAESDDSSGMAALQRLAEGPLRHEDGFTAAVRSLSPTLDWDRQFAKALSGRPVALGYYFTQLSDARAFGVLPAPVMPLGALPDGGNNAARWGGYGANVGLLAQAAPIAGFINAPLRVDDDGVIRSIPLLARYRDVVGQARSGVYESLALAVFRLATGAPSVTPIVGTGFGARNGGEAPLEGIALQYGARRLVVPLGPQASALVPFRGVGGPTGGSFRYISAARVLGGVLGPEELRGKIVLIGATAPALGDLRATPVDATYPGVEVHANVISGMLDGTIRCAPDYAVGYDVIVLLIAGLVLAFGMSMLRAGGALVLGGLTVAALGALNLGLYLRADLVMPLAAALLMTLSALALNMGWGYGVEERSRRRLAQLFGTYVPPELVEEMLVLSGHRFSMRAESRELTVMFCDMRGFTHLSEQMEPLELQAFLNAVFSRLTQIINQHRGTVDKYMGDCVMAFWGAPVAMDNHATLAVQAAIEMADAVHQINNEHRADGRPEISVGIGLNTGVMSVGDMGSAVRRSYTVIGDAVNLASRFEGLTDHYGVDIVAGNLTRSQTASYVWQELDLVRVKGRAQTVPIFTPIAPLDQLGEVGQEQQERWASVISAYKAQNWVLAKSQLAYLLARNEKKVLYRLYAERLVSLALQPVDPAWDGATQFDTK